MKKTTFLILWAMMLNLFTYAQQPKHEFRATWLATVQNIDWPKTIVTSNSTREQQKKELTDILDKMVAGNMHACFMQVRSLCDAMYKSSYEPWSTALTGTRGKDPGYDPLQFAIEEAHKRGLELHIWVNPFRVTSSGTLNSSDKLYQHAGDWIIKYNNGSFTGQIIDPGFPEARQYVINVLMEIVNNYDVDGIVMDDYFYPYGGTTTEDAKSKSLYKPNNVIDVNQDGDTDDDWRRTNVDVCLKQLYDTIQAVKPWVRFGMGTFGIWSTQKKAAEAYGITLPSGIRGLDDYDVQACNPVEWVKHGYVDYINPQLYWSTNVAAQDYKVLCKWWAKDVCEHFSNQLPNEKKVHFFISQAAYRAYDGSTGYEAGVGEIQKQIDVNRANLSSGYTGSVFYNTTAYNKMYLELKESHFPYKALPPAMDWKVTTALEAPTNLTLSGSTLSWQHPTAERFIVYAFPAGTNTNDALTNPAYLKGIVWGKSVNISSFGDLKNTTIAVVTYDRFGVEHGVAIYSPTPDITWVLNGGELPSIEVPTNEELWKMFKTDFDAFYAERIPGYVTGSDLPITSILEYTWPTTGAVGDEFMQQHPNWQWLSEYIQSIAGTINDLRQWRFNLYAFFNATNKVAYADGSVIAWAECGDFTTAGQPKAWGPAYQTAKGAIILPQFVDSEYTLPTNLTHPSGYNFLGWWDNASFTGAQLYTIPAYWKGTLYANWQSTPTNLEQVLDMTIPMKIYDITGRYVGEVLSTNQHGVFIVIQGENSFKIVL
jgi:uncharacterized lipoprotein YddW (UPF0748 family)